MLQLPTHVFVLCHVETTLYLVRVCASPGSVTDTDTEVGIPNTEKYRIPKKKYQKKTINRYFNFVKQPPRD